MNPHDVSLRSSSFREFPNERVAGIPGALRPSSARGPLKLALLVISLIFLTWPSFAEPPEFRIDPLTGNAVAQLTQTNDISEVFAQDNYALYYHQNSQSENGQFLVYRYLECGCSANGCGYSPSSLEYRRLDLETGDEKLMVERGLANGAVVHGSHLYVAKRDTTADVYDRLERIDLDLVEDDQCLTPLPTGHEHTGALTVNADDTIMIYQTFLTGSAEKGVYTWAHFIDPAASSTCPTSHSDLELHAVEPGLEHIQFSPTDPDVFTFIDQKESSLTRMGIGTVTSTGFTWNNLASSFGYLSSFDGYPHPFWDADGALWSDAVDLGGSAVTEAFIQLDLDEALGWVESYASVEMTSDDWHHHQNGGRSLGWFVGDGLNIESRAGFGEPFISLFHLDPPPDRIGGSLTRYHLADSLNAEDSGRGNFGANAHLLETLDGAVFAAPFDFATDGPAIDCGCPDSRNIFLVKIPPHLRAHLRDTVTITSAADGPFKHASRLSVSTDGQSWNLDYGQGGATPSIGDGVLDRQAGGLSSSSQQAALADINGDGVDDRLAFSPISTGGGIIDLAYSPYDGILPETDVLPDISRSYDGPWTLPPVFGDLNGDGRDDVIWLDTSGSEVLWQGQFSEDTDLPAVPYVALNLPWEVAAPFGDSNLDVHFFAADVNGDGYADRVTVRPEGSWWRWSLDLSSASGFGDGIEDAFYVGAIQATDIPLMEDVTLDGRADIVIARQQNESFRWYVNPSSAAGFGNAWDPPVGRGFFGSAGEQPLIGVFGRFHSVHP